MFNDFKELLSAFNAHSVRYLVVGGYAVSFHAQPRATKDLDLFIKADQDNVKATYAALASFGAPLDNISVGDLCDAQKFIASDGSRSLSIFSPALTALFSMKHGKGVWKV